MFNLADILQKKNCHQSSCIFAVYDYVFCSSMTIFISEKWEIFRQNRWANATLSAQGFSVTIPFSKQQQKNKNFIVRINLSNHTDPQVANANLGGSDKQLHES